MDTSTKIIYPKLSYEIVGALFDVFNDVGPNHKEKYYQNALALALKDRGLSFEREKHISVKYKNSKVGSYYLDFLIESKVILEIKVGERFLKPNIGQILTYLKTINLKLGILGNFTKTSVQFKRVININS